MKNITIFIAVLLIFLGPVNSFPATLEEIKKVELNSNVQFYLSFDSVPEFSIKQTERRIDILLHKTKPSDTVVFPVADKNIIRYATSKSKDLLTLTFFLRYLPEEYNITQLNATKLVVDLFPGSIYTKSFKNLTRQLDGVSQSQADSTVYGNPLTDSLYGHDWKSFFSQYEPAVSIDIPISFSWPPFPIIQFLPPGYSKNNTILPQDLLDAAANGSWASVISAIPELIEKNIGNIETQKLLALTYGEALGRMDNFEASYKQLYVLNEKYSSELIAVLSQYLLLRIQAQHTDAYLANVEITQLMPKIPPQNSLLPYAKITAIETSLATKNLIEMNTLLLQDDIAFPQQIEEIKQLRQADYWNALQQPIKASAAYRLIDNPNLLTKYPASLNASCNSLYNQQKYNSASDCYLQLKPLITDSDKLSLIMYRQLMAASHENKGDNHLKFSQIAESFPDSEGGARSLLKTYDLDILKTDDPNKYDELANVYRNVGDSNPERSISEEAYFKSALASYLAHDYDSTIKTLSKLHREFQTGSLRKTSEALLIDALPKEIERLSLDKKYEQVIVLARQNKRFFLENWLPSSSMVNTGYAYLHLGLYDEAHNLFLYLLTKANKAEQQALYLPLIQSSYFSGRYNRVDDYATRYRYNYPSDATNKDILIYQSKALIHLGKYKKAMQIFPTPIPNDPEIQGLALSIFFQNGEYKKVLDLLEEYSKKSTSDVSDNDILFMEAESLYKTDQLKRSNEIYRQIPKSSRYWPQSLYRQAEYFTEQGKKDEAKTVLEELVKSHKTSNWAKLAQQEIIFINNSTPN